MPEKFGNDLTHLQGEEEACPAEDDELVDDLPMKPVDELVELQDRGAT